MRRLVVSTIVVLTSALVTSGCASHASNAPDAGPAPTDDVPAIVSLTDLDPDPDVVEVQLVASLAKIELTKGKPSDVWAYRDGARAGAKPTIPGPMLEAKLGDLVVVHFRNELDRSTTVHWHGPRIANAMDGSQIVQAGIEPGSSFTYRFRVRDSGGFWYHPHERADEQIAHGLYGPILLHGGIAPEVAADRTLVLADTKLSSDGTLSEATTADDMMFGRQGNAVLVNGVRDGRLAVESGSRERWRLLNASNGRFFNLAIAGHAFRVIGWDGGMLPAPYLTDTLLITPGERYDVLIDVEGTPGASVPLQSLPFASGAPDPGTRNLLRLDFAAGGTRGALPITWGRVDRIATDASTFVRPFVLTEIVDGLPEPEFLINGEAWPFNKPISVTLGDTEIWEVRNEATMDHPFHLHGTFFQVIDRDGLPEPHLGWKDTAMVKARSTLRFAVRYDAPGKWMFHCHILEHQERGMMGEIHVGAARPTPPR